MYKRILVSTDGSELSGKAVDHAIALAKVHGAELVALKVVHLQTDDHWDGALIQDGAAKAEQEKRWSAASQAIVDGVQAAATAAGVKVQALTEKSNFVADTVIDVARKTDCDLIVMGKQGESSVEDMLLGSVTRYALAQSQCDVLISV